MAHARTILVAITVALLVAGGLVTTGGTASAQAAPGTALTLKVAGCDGCKVTLGSVLASDYEDVWTSPTKKVKGGEVTFQVPADRTAGLTIAVNAPWEGAVPYQTIAVVRYKGYQPGDKVSYADVRDAKRGAGCWAGTTESSYTMKLVVKQVTVQGNVGPVQGTIAFAKRTQDWMQPMRQTWQGVLGSQDVFGCGSADG